MGFAATGLCVVALVTAATFRPYVSFRQSLLPSVKGSYVAWVCFSLLVEPSLFSIFFPFFLPLMGNLGAKFFPFLAEPIQAGFLCLAVAALFVRIFAIKRSFTPVITFLTAFSLNALFIAVTLQQASVKADREISVSAASLHPVCLRQSTFFESLMHLDDHYPHAWVRLADGSQYYWSYSKKAFFRGSAPLDINFPCVPAPLLPNPS